MSQTEGLDANRHRLDSQNEETDVSTFLIVLEGVVYAVGGGFLLIGSYIGYKVATGSAGTVYQVSLTFVVLLDLYTVYTRF